MQRATFGLIALLALAAPAAADPPVEADPAESEASPVQPPAPPSEAPSDAPSEPAADPGADPTQAVSRDPVPDAPQTPPEADPEQAVQRQVPPADEATEAEAIRVPEEEEPRDIVVIGDLNLGLGKDAEGRWHPREDFRWTRALDGFLNQLLTRGEPVDLVVNGGLLDLWEVPEGVSCAGPDCQGDQVLEVARAVIAAHALDLALIGRFSRIANNRVFVVPGPQDAGLTDERVWQLLVAAMTAPVDPVALQALAPKAPAAESTETTVPTEAEGLEASAEAGADPSTSTDPEPEEDSVDVVAPPAEPLTVAVFRVEGRYVAGDGRVVVEPGAAQGPSAAFVQRVIAGAEASMPLIDNLRPASRGALGLLADGSDSAYELADFLRDYSLQNAPTHRAATVVDEDEEAPQYKLKKARKQGHLFFADQLEPDMPLRASLLNAPEEDWTTLRVELAKRAKALDDDETRALCDRTSLHRAKYSSRGAYPRCDGPQQYSTKLAKGRASWMAAQLQPVYEVHEDLQIYVQGSSRQPLFGWSIQLDERGRDKALVFNSGAFQRAVDPTTHRVLAAQLAETRERDVDADQLDAALRDLDLRHLPACYQAVVIDYDEGVFDPVLHHWYSPDSAERGQLLGACDDPCGGAVPQCGSGRAR